MGIKDTATSNGKRYIRISLCAKEEKLAEALERIKGIM